jgi:NAD(P)H dehydrogenase (quinone)
MDVAEPVLVHGVHGYHTGTRKVDLEARLARVLADQRSVIARLGERALMPFNADADFDGEGRLRRDAPSHWPFIRHSD